MTKSVLGKGINAYPQISNIIFLHNDSPVYCVTKQSRAQKGEHFQFSLAFRFSLEKATTTTTTTDFLPGSIRLIHCTAVVVAAARGVEALCIEKKNKLQPSTVSPITGSSCGIEDKAVSTQTATHGFSITHRKYLTLQMRFLMVFSRKNRHGLRVGED